MDQDKIDEAKKEVCDKIFYLPHEVTGFEYPEDPEKHPFKNKFTPFITYHSLYK